MKRFWVFAGMLPAVVAAPALAHHSFAMFDRGHRITLVGEVQELEFENPHSWLKIMVPGDRGEPTVWSFEMGPPGVLKRQGWTPGTVQAGERVTVRFHPMRDESAAGQLISVSFPDGRTLAGGPTGGTGEDELDGR